MINSGDIKHDILSWAITIGLLVAAVIGTIGFRCDSPGDDQ